MAILQMAQHWQKHNNFPNGTVHFAVQTMAGTNEVFDCPPFDTYTPRKTIRQVVTAAAFLGGLVVMAAGGPVGAPVGIVLLDLAVSVLTVTLVLNSINERMAIGKEFKVDAHCFMDMTLLVTSFIGMAGALRALLGAVQKAHNGMLVFNLGVGAFSFGMMTEDTRQAIENTNARYTVAITKERDPAEKKKLEAEHRKAIASILGAAAVNGGLILISAGLAARHAIASRTSRARATGGPEQPGLPSRPRQPTDVTPRTVRVKGRGAPHEVYQYPEGLVHLELTVAEARHSYRVSIRNDPSREAAIYVDPKGEHIVVQGTRNFVGTEWFNEAGMGRPWKLVEHYHPGGDPYPSTNDWFAMMDYQVNRGFPEEAVSSRILLDPVRNEYTEFGYEPSFNEKPYWIRFHDGPKKRFKDTPWNANSDYIGFLRDEGVPQPSTPGKQSGLTPATPSSVESPLGFRFKNRQQARFWNQLLKDVEARGFQLSMEELKKAFKAANEQEQWQILRIIAKAN